MSDNRKPFDLEAAKNGAPIVTRSGVKARFIAHVPECSSSMRVIVLIDGRCATTDYSEDGSFLSTETNDADLFMAPKQRTVWVNFYEFGCSFYYDTEEDASEEANRTPKVIAIAVPVTLDI